MPWDPILFGNALNNGEMLDKAGKSSKVVAEIDRLAEVVSGAEPVDKKDKAKAKGKDRSRRRTGGSVFGFAR